MNNMNGYEFTFSTFIVLFLVSLAGLGMWGCPTYKVWQQGKAGEAELTRAHQNRQIMIQEAQARLESSRLDAQSEVERARGMAEAMDIENGTLNSTYNQYLFIRTLEKLADGGNHPQIIYLPTESMIPVMDIKTADLK